MRWVKRLAAAVGVLLALAVAWVLVGAWGDVHRDPSVAPRCLAVRCGGEVLDCLRDAECKAWLECMQECGGETMRCPTFCGAYYQSPRVAAFTRCGLEKACIEVSFAGLPACAAPASPRIPLERADGTWWVAAIKGPDYVLFDDCQRFVFESEADGGLRAHNSMPLTRHGETRLCRNEGRYTRTPDDTMQLVYENWNGYRELWRYSYRSENAMLAHVCSSGSPGEVHEYGTFILTRTSLEALAPAERADLERALKDIYGLELGALTPLRTTSCPND